MYNGQHFLLVDRVVQFSTFKSHWIKSNWPCSFPAFTKGQHCSRMETTSICHQENFLFGVSVINSHQTVMTDYNWFDCFKSHLMMWFPWWESAHCVGCCQEGWYSSVCSEVWKEGCEVMHQIQKTVHICSTAWLGPAQNLLDFTVVRCYGYCPITSRWAYEFSICSTGASWERLGVPAAGASCLPSWGQRLVLPSLGMHVPVCRMCYDP